MKTAHTKLLLSILNVGVIALLAACESASESSSPWVKGDSPWGKRQPEITEAAEAPAADTYKEDLANIDTASTTGVEMGYQTEKVESGVPSEPQAEEPAAVQEPVPVVAEIMAQPESGNEFRNIPANYYTVQVIASVDENYVYTFAKKHQLSARYVIPTMRDGKTWYVLLLDAYPDKAAAKSALDEAATTLPNKPWMRTVGSVQVLMP